MNHAEYLVDLVDENGTVVGSKQRQEIDKSVDLCHTVFVLLHTPESTLILSKIPARKDLPNTYSGNLGATAVTIRRHDETADEAGLRAIKNELYLEDVALTNLGDSYIELPDGHKKYISVYHGKHPTPSSFSYKDIEHLTAFSHKELTEALRSNKDQFAPTFLAIWQKYQADLFPAQFQ